MVSRTWALWTRHAACMQRKQLGKDPLGLLEEATGLRLAELLGVAFAYWAKVVENRSSGGE
jgi:hypothetical protein